MGSFTKNLSRTVLPLAVAVAAPGVACLVNPTEEHHAVAEADTPADPDAGAAATDAGAPQCGSTDGGVDAGLFPPNPYLGYLGYGPSYLGYGGGLGGYLAEPGLYGAYGSSLGAYGAYGAYGGLGGLYGLGAYGYGGLGVPYAGLPYGAGYGYLGYPGSWSSYLGLQPWEYGAPPGGWPSGYGPGQAPPDGGCY